MTTTEQQRYESSVQEKDVRRVNGSYKTLTCRHCGKLLYRIAFSMTRSPANDRGFAAKVAEKRQLALRHLDQAHPVVVAS